MPSEQTQSIEYTQKRYREYKRALAELQRTTDIIVGDNLSLPVRAVGIIPQPQQRLLAITAQANIQPLSGWAVELLTLTNYLFLKRTASKYLGKGLEEEDMIQEATEGIMRSLSKYDPKKEGNNFLTYASWWIRQSIGRAVQERGTAIKLPAYLYDVRIKVERYMKERPHEFFDAKQITKDLNKESAGKDIKPEHVESVIDYLLSTAYAPLSLDQPLQNDDGEGMSIGERVVCEVSTEEALKRAEQSRLAPRVRDIINQVITDPFQKTVICRHYGLEGSSTYTAKEISEQLGEETPNRVNKAIQNAKKQLKPALVAAGITQTSNNL